MLTQATRTLMAVLAVALAACQDSPLPVTPVSLSPEPREHSVTQMQVADELPHIPLNGVPGQVVPDQYIVRLKSGVTAVSPIARRIARVHGARVGFIYESALKGFSARMPAAVAARLARDPMVEYIEPDRVVTSDGGAQNNAPWGLDRINQTSLPLSNTYSWVKDGAGVRIYIIDSGVRITHQDFLSTSGASRAQYSWDFVDNDATASDCAGHGTHVAGIAAGKTYGVAKYAYIRAVRVLNCTAIGTTSNVIAGVEWVTANHISPAVANMSLGGAYSASLDLAVFTSIASGVTYVVSAGNGSIDACLRSPASTSMAITVMSSASDDSRSSFSNYGPCADIYAPGSSVKSAYNTSDAATAIMSGTSMAAPHVAGVAAQYLSSGLLPLPSVIAARILAAATSGKITGNFFGTSNLLLHSY